MSIDSLKKVYQNDTLFPVRLPTGSNDDRVHIRPAVTLRLL